MGTRRRSTRLSESGDTLIELLIAAVIIGGAAVAILGALTTSITASAEHRTLVVDDTFLKSFAEQTKDQIELQPKTSGPPATPFYEDCSPATPPAKVLTDYQTLVPQWGGPGFPYPSGFAGYPKGYVSKISAIQFWNTKTHVFDSQSAATTGCNNANPSLNTDASGIQQITMTVSDPTGQQLDLTILVRNPDYASTYCALYNTTPGNNCS